MEESKSDLGNGLFKNWLVICAGDTVQEWFSNMTSVGGDVISGVRGNKIRTVRGFMRKWVSCSVSEFLSSRSLAVIMVRVQLPCTCLSSPQDDLRGKCGRFNWSDSTKQWESCQWLSPIDSVQREASRKSLKSSWKANFLEKQLWVADAEPCERAGATGEGQPVGVWSWGVKRGHSLEVCSTRGRGENAPLVSLRETFSVKSPLSMLDGKPEGERAGDCKT